MLWSIQALVRGRWNLALVLIGAATSLHVVVGGWAAVLTALVWLVLPRDRTSLTSILPGIVGAFFIKHPRFVLCLEVRLGRRFRNHLGGKPHSSGRAIAAPFAPDRVSNRICAAASVAVGMFVLLCAITPTDSGGRRFRAFVAAAMGLAGIGFALGWLVSIAPLTAASVLRFYWFRMSDILVPARCSDCCSSVFASAASRKAKTCPLEHYGACFDFRV